VFIDYQYPYEQYIQNFAMSGNTGAPATSASSGGNNYNNNNNSSDDRYSNNNNRGRGGGEGYSIVILNYIFIRINNNFFLS